MQNRVVNLGKLAVGRVVLWRECVGGKAVPAVVFACGDGNRVSLRVQTGGSTRELTGVRHVDGEPRPGDGMVRGEWDFGPFDKVLIAFLFPETGDQWSLVRDGGVADHLLVHEGTAK